jgi:hypothetical protein
MSLHHRGGARPNAGRKSGWSTSDTQTIRVPRRLASRLLEIAKKLDFEEEALDFVSESKMPIASSNCCIDIKGILEKWSEMSNKYAPSPNTRWDNARTLLEEIKAVFYPPGSTQLNITDISGLKNNLTALQLAHRFNITDTTIRMHQKKLSSGEFLEWSKSKDPLGRGWNYNLETKLYDFIE